MAFLLPTTITPPEDMTPAMAAMVQATISSAWSAYKADGGDTGNPEGFWEYLIMVG